MLHYINNNKINPTQRAETLSIKDWQNLTKNLPQQFFLCNLCKARRLETVSIFYYNAGLAQQFLLCDTI